MKLTSTEINDLKKKHGELYEITVDDKSCIIRKPNRNDLSYASVVKDPIKMSETLFNQLWVCGDEEMKTDDSYFLAAIAKMEPVLEVKEAEIKKL